MLEHTPEFGGFFLLQLQDFPGQGEALVGLLDSFWNSKGILTPEEFRRWGHAVVDWIADYQRRVESLPVLSHVQPIVSAAPRKPKRDPGVAAPQ